MLESESPVLKTSFTQSKYAAAMYRASPSLICGESKTTLCFAVIFSIQLVSHCIADCGGIESCRVAAGGADGAGAWLDTLGAAGARAHATAANAAAPAASSPMN